MRPMSLTATVPDLPILGQTIQSAVAPVFLLVATGGILNVTTGRLARVVDRSRALEGLYRDTTGPEHQRVVWELRRLDRRMTIINSSISLCVACGVVVCLMVAALFGGEVAGFSTGVPVALLFVVAMALLIGGLVLFLVEVRLAAATIRVRKELLERDRA